MLREDLLRIARWALLPLALPIGAALLLQHGNLGPRQGDIIAHLKSEDPDTREVALYWSGALRLPSFVPHVVKHFDEERRTRRKLAIQALAKDKDPTWGAELFGAFQRHEDMRQTVIDSLRMVYHPETLPWLERIAAEYPEYRDSANQSIETVRRIMLMEYAYYTPTRRIYNRFGYVIFSQLALFPEGRAMAYGFQPALAEREAAYRAARDAAAGS